MFCPNCGAKNEDGSKFCMKCGADLSGAAPEKKSNPAGDAMRNFSSRATGAMNTAKNNASDDNMVPMILTLASALLLLLSIFVKFASVSYYGFSVGGSLFTSGSGLLIFMAIIILACAIGEAACFFLGQKALAPLLGIVGLVCVVISLIYLISYGLTPSAGFFLGAIGGVLAIVNKIKFS